MPIADYSTDRDTNASIVPGNIRVPSEHFWAQPIVNSIRQLMADIKAGGGGLNNIVEDLTPQLGGNLDLNGFLVGAASAADLTKLAAITASAAQINTWFGITRAAGFDTFVATPSSANLAALLTDETGTAGKLVFSNSPTFVGDTIIYEFDDSASQGPVLVLHRDSSSPAALDLLGRIEFGGEDSASNYQAYALISSEIADPTNGSEDGQLTFNISVAGVMTRRFYLDAIGTTFIPQILIYSDDPGAGYGPIINIYRDSPSPANFDGLGYIIFSGEDAAGNYTEYAHIRSNIVDTTNGSEDGELTVHVVSAGTMRGVATFGSNYLIQFDNDAGAGEGPFFQLFRNSASPAASDNLGALYFQGMDSGANTTNYAVIKSVIDDPTNGSEDGRLVFSVITAGTVTVGMELRSDGLVVGNPTGGSNGLGSINAQQLYTNNGLVGPYSAPVTKTANFTVADTEHDLINNKAGSSCTVTLPSAASWPGRELYFKTLQAQTTVSASSNVVPLGSTTAGTAILSANVGRWCRMVSDGTNWVIMAGVI